MPHVPYVPRCVPACAHFFLQVKKKAKKDGDMADMEKYGLEFDKEETSAEKKAKKKEEAAALKAMNRREKVKYHYKKRVEKNAAKIRKKLGAKYARAVSLTTVHDAFRSLLPHA